MQARTCRDVLAENHDATAGTTVGARPPPETASSSASDRNVRSDMALAFLPVDQDGHRPHLYGTRCAAPRRSRYAGALPIFDSESLLLGSKPTRRPLLATYEPIRNQSTECTRSLYVRLNSKCRIVHLCTPQVETRLAHGRARLISDSTPMRRIAVCRWSVN